MKWNTINFKESFLLECDLRPSIKRRYVPTKFRKHFIPRCLATSRYRVLKHTALNRSQLADKHYKNATNYQIIYLPSLHQWNYVLHWRFIRKVVLVLWVGQGQWPLCKNIAARCNKLMLKRLIQMPLFSSRDRICVSICKQICLLCVVKLKLNSLWSYGSVYITWLLFTLCGCQWLLKLNVTELTTWIFYISLSPLYVTKYGGYGYLTSNLYHHGHKALFRRRDICLYYVGVNDILT